MEINYLLQEKEKKKEKRVVGGAKVGFKGRYENVNIIREDKRWVGGAGGTQREFKPEEK